MNLEEKIKWLEDYYTANGFEISCEYEKQLRLEIDNLFKITYDEWKDYFDHRPNCEYTIIYFSINDYWKTYKEHAKVIKNITAIIPKSYVDYFSGFPIVYNGCFEDTFDTAWNTINLESSTKCIHILNGLIEHGRAKKLQEDCFTSKYYFDWRRYTHCDFPFFPIGEFFYRHWDSILPIEEFVLNNEKKVKLEIKPSFLKDLVIDIINKKLNNNKLLRVK